MLHVNDSTNHFFLLSISSYTYHSVKHRTTTTIIVDLATSGKTILVNHLEIFINKALLISFSMASILFITHSHHRLHIVNMYVFTMHVFSFFHNTPASIHLYIEIQSTMKRLCNFLSNKDDDDDDSNTEYFCYSRRQ